jgi:hypothetical protein
MADEKEHAALSHIEKTLADSYRKEIDQEENVWRSLPFFAATIALELTALFQLLNRLPVTDTRALISHILLILTGVLLATALVLLAACIAPVRFRYLSREPLLLRFTDELIEAEQASKTQNQALPLDALALLKRELAHQYSVATDHNRRINKRRELLRAFAGLCVVGSVLAILLLVAVAFAYYVPERSDIGDVRGSANAVTTPNAPADGRPAPADPARPSGAPDANRH